MSSNKETLKEAGYKMIKSLGDGLFVLQNKSGKKEIWGANKNHASYGLIYKNTHLEFVSSKVDLY